MKKIIIILALLIFSGNIFAQHRRGSTIKWLSLSVKAGGGNSILYNKDYQTDKNVNLDVFTPSYFLGSRFTITVGDNIGFGAEGLYSKFGQNYDIAAGGASYTKKMDMKSTEILFFFRYTSEYGGYFEVGPKISMLKSATLTNSIQATEFLTIEKLQAQYASQFTSIMLGAGISIFHTERVSGKLGARLNYSLSDFTPDKSFSILNDGVYAPAYQLSETTNPFSAQILLEINYFFGFWGNASCGRGSMQFFK